MDTHKQLELMGRLTISKGKKGFYAFVSGDGETLYFQGVDSNEKFRHFATHWGSGKGLKDAIKYVIKKLTQEINSNSQVDIVYGKCQLRQDSDPVNHPDHYNKHPSGVECITITEHMNFNCGNAVKYIWRADLKNGAVEDLKKAEFYIKREIARREESSL